MEPQLPNEDLLQIFLYDYLKKRRLLTTAEAFRNETGHYGQVPNEYDQPPHGLLYNIWNSLFFSNPRQQVPQPQVIAPPDNPSLNFQALNIGAAINTVPQVIRDRYSVRHLSSFPSGLALLYCDISSDGKVVASGGHGKKPFICFPGTTHSDTSLESHSSSILDIRFQPESHIFATASADKTVKLWDANSPKKALFDFVGHNVEVRSLDFHPLGGILCTSGTDDEIKVWDLNQNVSINSFVACGGQLRFRPGSGSVLAVANRNIITIYDSHNFRALNHLMGHVGDINSMCWDATGTMLASISDDGVCVWLVFNHGQCLHRYPLCGRRYHSVIFHPRYDDVLVIGGFQCMELLVLESEIISSARAADLSVTGLATTTGQSEYIASVSQSSGVNIWK